MSLPHGPVHEFGIHLLWRSADTVVLEVVGEIDLWAASTLLAAAEDELADGRRLLVIDAAGVSFCSARGVGTLVEVRRRAHRRGAAVRVVNPSRHVRRVALLGRWCDGSGRTDELA